MKIKECFGYDFKENKRECRYCPYKDGCKIVCRRRKKFGNLTT